MKPITLSLLLAISLNLVQAQTPTRQLKQILKLEIPMEGGANGASVTWHPVLKRYYAAMAGNKIYSLGVYDATGKRLSPEEQTTKFDIRGLWYNPISKTIQMNGYSSFGWAEYKLNSKGFPDTVRVLFEGSNQPGDQSVGAFNPARKVVYFFNDEGNLDAYTLANGKFLESVELALGRTKKDDDETDAALGGNYDVMDDYNPSIVFTGTPGAEIGILNHTEKQIELYNLKDGHLVRKLSIPEEAPVESFLNFSYCNGIWWLFDRDARTWIGYK